MNDWRIGSLFAGIGGLELGLERAGLGETVVQVEQDPFALEILENHWPKAKRYTDVREVGAKELGKLDVLCGGFPCQDISNANQNANGLDGERSGLWFEFARIIGEVRPRIVVVENVAALLRRGIDRVLRDLAEMGYDAEWGCISAASVGAHHLRERIFIVAYPHGFGQLDGGPGIFSTENQQQTLAVLGSRRATLADANGVRCEGPARVGNGFETGPDESGWRGPNGQTRANVGRPVVENGGVPSKPEMGDANGSGLEGRQEHLERENQRALRPTSRSVPGRWCPEPLVGRVANGIPSRVDRLRCLGNAVVPQVAEYVGGLIVSAFTGRHALEERE